LFFLGFSSSQLEL